LCVAAADETLGARNRRLREAHGMTRPELAAAMRVFGARTEAHDVARYEGDVYEPKLRAFVVLARALGVTVEVLLYGEEEAARIADERTRGEPFVLAIPTVVALLAWPITR
jgi:transcriptional regulator with XRE-family HTH domain